MRVLIVIGLPIAVVFMMVAVLVDLVCDLSRQSYQAPPDLDSSDIWNVEVDEFDDSTTTPISGWLMAHSPHRQRIHAEMLRAPRDKHLLVEYSENKFPKGVVAAFSGHGSV